MSKSSGLGFGGFLVGLGGGYVLFQTMEISRNLFAWLLVIAGAGIVASSLLQRMSPGLRFGSLVSGVVGGLILSLMITSGFSFFTGAFDSGTWGDYRAEEVFPYEGVATADDINLDFTTFNGYIRVYTWDSSEYSVEVTVRARGNTDKEAEDNIDDLDVVFEESVVGGQLNLVLEHNVPSTKRNLYSFLVEAYVPADATYDTDITTSNGAISLNNMVGDFIKLTTSNGEISFDNVFAERIVAQTSNAQIRGDIEAPDTSLTTSNGKIDLDLPCTVSGTYDLDTSNAAIDLDVSPSADVGYSIDMSTSNASVDLRLDGLEYTTNERTRKRA
ncbi:hypothetical protein E2P65_04120, partial [Candidatus Bathyarchaeota archaeon]